ncbi:hypothetical protein BGX26_001823 [Mortierella sp. AD094]|nr:hypothetical protein BGX26_001823 [Mortierella sp. AD094]
MATYEGYVRRSSIMLSVMSKYFFFLVVNVLLISTLSGGILKTIKDLQVEGFKFDAVISRFAEKLPEASTFFITYALLRGFTGPVLELLQIEPLLLNSLITQRLAKSPRQVWGVQGRLKSVNYGVLFPPQTLMFCIGALYSTISPPVLPFVAFYFTMDYFVYRHQFLYVYRQPVETGGLAFPKAVKQAFTGIFISQITLFGIFLMKQVTFNEPAIPQLVLIVILIVITAYALRNMKEAFDPLVTFLPIALFSKGLHVDKRGVVTHGDKKQKAPKLQDEEQPELKEENMCMNNISKQDPSLGKDPLLEIRPTFKMTKTEYYENGETQSDPLTHQHRSSTSHYSPNDSIQPQPQSMTRPNLQVLHQSDGPVPHSQPASSLDRPVSFARRRPVTSVGFTQYSRIEDPESEARVEPSPEDAELERLQNQAYCHPLIYDVQKPVWLPMDERGLAQAEIDRLRGLGIIVATDGAALDSSTAKVRVAGIIYAPGDETQYRLERGE